MESGTKPRSVTAKNTVHKRNKKEEPVVDKNTRSSKRHKKTEQPDKSTTSKKRKEEETLPQAENEDDYLSTTHTKKRKQLSDFPISSLRYRYSFSFNTNLPSTTTKSKSKKKKNMETKGSDSSTNPPSSDAPKKSSEGFKGGLFGKQSDSFSPNPLGILFIHFLYLCLYLHSFTLITYVFICIHLLSLLVSLSAFTSFTYVFIHSLPLLNV